MVGQSLQQLLKKHNNKMKHMMHVYSLEAQLWPFQQTEQGEATGDIVSIHSYLCCEMCSAE